MSGIADKNLGGFGANFTRAAIYQQAGKRYISLADEAPEADETPETDEAYMQRQAAERAARSRASNVSKEYAVLANKTDALASLIGLTYLFYQASLVAYA